MNTSIIDGSSDNDEATLVSEWQRGDLAAGQKLLSKYYCRLVRFFSSKFCSEADDLVQDTMAAAMDGGMRFEGRATFGSYLISIARFRLYDHYRRKRRDTSLFESTDAWLDEPADSSVDAGSPAEADSVRAALHRLPEDYQAVLSLHYWEDLSGPEIAAVLGLPVDTAYSRLRKAKALLKKRIEAFEASDWLPRPGRFRGEELRGAC